MTIPPEASKLANEANAVFVDEDYEAALELYTEVRTEPSSHIVTDHPVNAFAGHQGSADLCRPVCISCCGSLEDGKFYERDS